ncbi:hypothetical protein AB0G83_11660 [Streptomyces klenkii]|uniref:hypothetical protein n=1 Tax=Streptomyces TaxID=1883 RepID=UPI001E641EA4|nr:hypothetical protein [Streptomyces sp. NRRL B-1677]
MSQVRRGIMQALAWVLATTAAMAVSWYGVRTVLTGTAYEPPRALPISGTTPPLEPAARGSAPSPSAPERSASSTPVPRSAAPAPSASSRSDAPSAPPPGDNGEVKSFPVRGGRAVFDLGESSAALVSATPDEGWQMRVWKQSAWIRVDFMSGTRTTSLFVTWNGHPPQVQTVEN